MATTKKLTMNLTTGKMAVKTVKAEEPKADKAPALPAVYRDGTHSAIVIDIGPKAVTLITMASLKLEEMRKTEFEASYELYAEYPVHRCAEVYLGSGQYRTIDPQTRERLEAIVGDKKSANYKPFVSPNPESVKPSTSTEKAIMPKTTVTAHPLRRASDAPLRAALAAKPNAAAAEKDKPTPAKKAAVSKDAQPVKAKKTAAAPAPVAEKPAAKKAAPAAEKPAKKAPWDAAKAKAAPAASAAEKAPRVRVAADAKATLGDADKAKKGKMRLFMDKAVDMVKRSKDKTVMRSAIESALEAGWEGDDLKTYFPYAVKNGMLVLA